MEPQIDISDNENYLKFLEVACEIGLETPTAEMWAQLQELLERKRNTSDEVEVVEVLENASEIIIDQHKQIEQLAAMTTI